MRELLTITAVAVLSLGAGFSAGAYVFSPASPINVGDASAERQLVETQVELLQCRAKRAEYQRLLAASILSQKR